MRLVFDLSNNGQSDYKLQKNVRLMARLANTDSLVNVKEGAVSLEDQEYLISAGEKAKVSLSAAMECRAEDVDWQICVEHTLKNAKAFVIFDENNRTEITVSLLKRRVPKG